MRTIVVPGYPAIEVGQDMFSHCGTMAELNTQLCRVRRIVPQWHDDGKTRGEIALHWQRRAEQIRGF